MKFSILISSFIVILLMINSCKKPEEKKNWTEVSVVATNPVTNEPIEDIYCNVLQIKNGFGLSSTTAVLQEGTTVNGEFNFGFLAEKNSKYSYTFSAVADVFEKYYRVNFTEFAYLDKGDNHFYEMRLVPYGYLSTKTTNISCFNENDEIIIYRPNIDVPEYNGYSSNPNPFYGCFDNTTSYTRIPMGRYAYEWHVTKNGTTEIFYDTLFLEAGDSVLYEINY